MVKDDIRRCRAGLFGSKAVMHRESAYHDAVCQRNEKVWLQSGGCRHSADPCGVEKLGKGVDPIDKLPQAPRASPVEVKHEPGEIFERGFIQLFRKRAALSKCSP